MFYSIRPLKVDLWLYVGYLQSSTHVAYTTVCTDIHTHLTYPGQCLLNFQPLGTFADSLDQYLLHLARVYPIIVIAAAVYVFRQHVAHQATVRGFT